jgi:hypothetical protein
MSLWLQAHVFTGLVGAYLVVLHSAWKFNGLAGVLTLLTLVVVFSGLIGRYLYTAVPRTLEGVETAFSELAERAARADRQLLQQGGERLREAARAASAALPRSTWLLVLARPLLRARQRRRWRRLIRGLDEASRARAERLREVVEERQRLQMQVASWDATRRLLALWHMFHVPLSGALFALAFIHILAALYYGTLLK